MLTTRMSKIPPNKRNSPKSRWKERKFLQQRWICPSKSMMTMMRRKRMAKMKRRRKMKVRTRTTKKRPKLALTMMIWMSEMIPPTRMKKRKKIRNLPMKNLRNQKKQKRSLRKKCLMQKNLITCKTLWALRLRKSLRARRLKKGLNHQSSSMKSFLLLKKMDRLPTSKKSQPLRQLQQIKRRLQQR